MGVGRGRGRGRDEGVENRFYWRDFKAEDDDDERRRRLAGVVEGIGDGVARIKGLPRLRESSARSVLG